MLNSWVDWWERFLIVFFGIRRDFLTFHVWWKFSDDCGDLLSLGVLLFGFLLAFLAGFLFNLALDIVLGLFRLWHHWTVYLRLHLLKWLDAITTVAPVRLYYRLFKRFFEADDEHLVVRERAASRCSSQTVNQLAKEWMFVLKKSHQSRHNLIFDKPFYFLASHLRILAIEHRYCELWVVNIQLLIA